MCKNGTWHATDIERSLSHVLAVAYAGKQKLRDSRDLSELHGILAPEDIQAMSESQNILNYCLRVVYEYIASLDRRDKYNVSQKRPVNHCSLMSMDRFIHIENVMLACVTMGEVPISPSFTIHLHVFAVFWFILFPLAFVEANCFLSYLYLPPNAYSVIKLLVMGDELPDPLGTEQKVIPLDMFCTEIKDLVQDIRGHAPEQRSLCENRVATIEVSIVLCANFNQLATVTRFR